jgi:hypothetical protein
MEEAMDTSRFDAWTRRQFGRTSSGVLVAALGLAAGEGAVARKKHKKKQKCRKVTESCGGKKKCCKNFTCDTIGIGAGTFCCRETQQTCTGIEGECCGDRVCNFIDGLESFRCCGVLAGSCDSDRDCCTGFLCNNQGQCIEV